MTRRKESRIVKDRNDIIPPASSRDIKDISKRPSAARIVFYLHEKGIASQTELMDALRLTQATVYYATLKLANHGFVRILRGKEIPNAFDKRTTYYRLTDSVMQNPNFMPELGELFRYEFLKAIERKYFNPAGEWVETEQLKEDEKFLKLIEGWGATFDDAIRLITSSGIFYVKKDRGNIEAVKRVFDNLGYRIEELEEPKEEAEEVIELIEE